MGEGGAHRSCPKKQVCIGANAQGPVGWVSPRGVGAQSAKWLPESHSLTNVIALTSDPPRVTRNGSESRQPGIPVPWKNAFPCQGLVT